MIGFFVSTFVLAASAGSAFGEISITSSSPAAVALFGQARDEHENGRYWAAQKDFEKALVLDPNFVLAESYLGLETPGPEGERAAAHAASRAGRLPEPERLLVEANLAKRRGDEEQERALWRRIAALAPGDWRSQFALGRLASFDRRSNAAIAALKKAIAINPNAAVVYNTLGYVYADLGDLDDAIASHKKYMQLLPDDPNPPDSLAENLLRAGRLDEAEQMFRRATELAKGQWMGFIGVAQIHFLRGDWAGGRKLVDAAREVAPRDVEKAAVTRYLAWSFLAQDRPAEAFKVLEEMESAALAKKQMLLHALVPVVRARMLNEIGASGEALRQLALARQRNRGDQLSRDDHTSIRRLSLLVQVWAESRQGDVEAAQRTVAALAREVTEAPSNTHLRSWSHFATGAVALARHEPTAAVKAFAQCSESDFYCRWQLVHALEATGEQAAAFAARKRLFDERRRDAINSDDADPMYLYVRSRMEREAAGRFSTRKEAPRP